MGNQRNHRNGEKDRKRDQLGSYFLVSDSHRLLVPLRANHGGRMQEKMTHKTTENGAETKKPQS